MQGTNIDRRCGQALTEELGEQGMQLVPRMTILIPGGQHEQVLRLERRDQLLCVGCVRHMTRDGHVDAAENRNLLQEVDQRLRQWGEDFLGKIVGKSRLVLRRGAQRLFAGAAFQRVRHQLQADRPPGGHVVIEWATSSFRSSPRQVLRNVSDSRKLKPSSELSISHTSPHAAEPAQQEARRDARGEHEVKVGGGPIYQQLHHRRDARVPGMLEVVEDQVQACADPCNGVDQYRCKSPRTILRADLEQFDQLAFQRQARLLQGAQQVGAEEAQGLVLRRQR
ncbi:hypothetical protein D9M70_291490 [compost metagenome]